MILISHRGNTKGKIEKLENKPSYILQAINSGFNVEIDIWYINQSLWLGHDEPQYLTSLHFLDLHKNVLWIHCKNLDAITYFRSVSTDTKFNYFWHETDKVTITSQGYIWAYPGIICDNSIAVLPEIHNDNLDNRIGICSDYINDFK